MDKRTFKTDSKAPTADAQIAESQASLGEYMLRRFGGESSQDILKTGTRMKKKTDTGGGGGY